ncbi:MAG: hypothetical protein H7A46_18510 [Verrucomicrobiales bacterium]|nr:hypothetical protein [Verrucomicrobiales bacterium]
MQQIKIFKRLENELEALEKSVNEWLAAHPVQVIQIFGNIAPPGPKAPQASMISRSTHDPSDVLLIVVYEKA